MNPFLHKIDYMHKISYTVSKNEGYRIFLYTRAPKCKSGVAFYVHLMSMNSD